MRGQIPEFSGESKKQLAVSLLCTTKKALLSRHAETLEKTDGETHRLVTKISTGSIFFLKSKKLLELAGAANNIKMLESSGTMTSLQED